MSSNHVGTASARDAVVALRPYRADDADDLVTACNDPLIQRFVPAMPSPYTRHDALAWINESAVGGHNGHTALALADPVTDRVLGGGGFRRFAELTGEMGYWVAPWGRGRGVATSAARLLAQRAFDQGIERLSLRTEFENTASQRVAIAAGFTREGVQRAGGANRDGGRHDLIVWARLHTDPDAPKQRILPDLPASHPTAGQLDSGQGDSGQGGQLTDGVIRLRPMGAQDAQATYGLRSLPDVIATSVPPVSPDRDIVARNCARSEAGWLAGERANLVIIDAATGSYAGEIGLYYWEPVARQAMIGYSLMPQWRGRGYATRAAVLLSRWAFDVVGVARIIAGTAPENLGSQRVLERAGFVREGYQRSRLPGPGHTRIDDILYALIR